MSYYLVSSLPTLDLEEPSAGSPDDFLFHCQGALSPEEWCELSLIVEGRWGEGGSAFAEWWTQLDTQIRNQIVRHRAARLGVEARPALRMHSGYDVAVEEAVSDALARTNPLERELALDRCRWQALDERVQVEPFGFEAVLAYAIRLQLLERWRDLTPEKGLERIETFITENADQYLDQQPAGDA